MSIVVRRSRRRASCGCSIRAFLERDSAVAMELLAKGYYIVLPPISGPGPCKSSGTRSISGWSTTDCDEVVMEGTGAKAGESYAWAIANPDKVSLIYARNPVMRSLMSKAPPIDNLAPLAKAGVPILHDCGVSTRG